MIKLDLQSKTPLYLQMEQQIIDLILLGCLKENDQLPSVRNLARELGINPNTIQKAYQDMESRGIIYSVVGRGNFVASPSAAENLKRQECMAELERLLLDAQHAGISAQEIHRAVDAAFETRKEDDLQ
jgi:GntR family transcriptional regulator